MEQTIEKIMQIMALALEITPPDETQQLDGAPQVFVEYAAHIPAVYVYVYPYGWSENEIPDPDHRFSIYTSECKSYGDSIDDVIRYLTDLRDEVKQHG